MGRVELPPLRERREDIPLLVDHFLGLYGGGGKAVSPGAAAMLRSYGWPGNVRQLLNVLRRSMIVARGDVLTVEDLPPEIRGTGTDDGRALETFFGARERHVDASSASTCPAPSGPRGET